MYRNLIPINIGILITFFWQLVYVTFFGSRIKYISWLKTAVNRDGTDRTFNLCSSILKTDILLDKRGFVRTETITTVMQCSELNRLDQTNF